MQRDALVAESKRGLCGVIILVAATILMHLVHSPSPYLLGGLIGGAAFSLAFGAPWRFPEPARHFGMALIGVSAGALIDSDVIRRIASQPVEVLGGVAVTLVFSMATGLVLVLSPKVNLATAVFSSMAGAASGVSAMAKELDADDAIVSAVQYARVVVVVVSLSLVAPILDRSGSLSPADRGPAAVEPVLWQSLVFTALCMGVGLLLAQVLSFSGSRLVVPMLLSMAVALVVSVPLAVPEPLLDLGYTITGLAVGFSFTAATIRLLIRLFPLVLVQLVLSVGGCAVIGIVFARAVGIPDLAGYLAMTPGGLPAVTAVAVQSGAEVGLVITMQLVRVFAAILSASLIGTLVRRRSRLTGA
ncbi:putative ammonia monooxygenase [Parafrankia sp. EAN1pec]|uniref:AbrB family transcriptional regulator n=1 Tax=Frankiaceae TaxID=74712 RepID=UPI0000543515|nr:AbrB family transcriptional regulator [Frankia sp. Mgl5]ABW13913.1 putative ammonia monooxygenase [Frankia sp. EAN1pec]